MSGLSSLCNAGPLVKINGRSYQIKGRTLGHIGEAESQILYMRGDLLFYLTKASSAIEKSCRADVIKSSLRRIRLRWTGCKSEDIYRFYSSPEGRIFSFWQSIRDNGLSFEEAERLYLDQMDIDEEWETRIKWAIEMTTGESDISKLYTIGNMAKSKTEYMDSYLISKSSLFSMLAKEPFSFTQKQVADMTLFQIHAICSSSVQEDVGYEFGTLTGKSPATYKRKALKSFEDAYQQMADNISEGRSLTSGLANT